jgi:two-component system response regulator NreC
MEKSVLKIKLIIADDHKIIREGVKALVDTHENLELVAEAADGQSAIQAVLKYKPDIVIMDVNMPNLNGIEATRKILSDFPGIKIIALSMHSDRRFVGEMLRAGASGYMLKDCAFNELVRAIQEVMDGKIYLSPGVASVVVEEYINNKESRSGSVIRNLTQREKQVLQMIAEGYTTKEIAKKMSLSTKTVETHRKKIMDKLNIYNIAALTKLAIREGLTTLED